MDSNNKLSLLVNLITDDEFSKLQNISYGLNFFKIAGIASQEIKHSNTIAWFLDPLGHHNFGSLFFRKFITRLFEEKKEYFDEQNINILELLLSDLDNLKIIREKENDIDILIKSKNNEFVICIENKVRAGIGDEQLNKYYEYITEKYSTYNKKIFILLTPEGYEVPVDKSENPEKWIPASYEYIAEILRSFLVMNIEQKVHYIINDYIELLEKEYIVENKELNDILEKICSRHKDAIDMLVEYRDTMEESQSVIKRIQKIFSETLKKLEHEEKIKCKKSSLENYCLEFYTISMNKYFPKLEDKSGSYQNGTKYKYQIHLKRESKKPCIILELGPLGQDKETIAKFNMIRKSLHKSEVNSVDKNSKTKSWPIDIDWSDSSLADIDAGHVEEQIITSINEIFKWEDGLKKIAIVP
jgi:hypothetical protein